MMKRWTREKPLLPGTTAMETWRLEEEGTLSRAFAVHCTYGKEIQLAAVKRRHDYQAEVERVHQLQSCFTPEDYADVTRCLACGSLLHGAKPLVTVFEVDYLECLVCNHAVASRRPSDEALAAYYERSAAMKDYYTDSDEIRLRMTQIYEPKIHWIARAFERVNGRLPESLLDFGAGSGHFVSVAREAGLSVEGMEPDRSYRAWAADHLGLTLASTMEEVLEKQSGGFDVVTSFNTIEHVVDPSRFLSAMKRVLAPEGMTVVETPRFDSFSVGLQRIFPDAIRGYLVPCQHIQLFTLSSLLHLHLAQNLKPTACWYFGQDAAELSFQLGRQTAKEPVALADAQFNALQALVDRAGAGDLIMIAGSAKG